MVARHFGAMPPRELKVRLQRLPGCVRLRAAEEREVVRARRGLRARPSASTVTVIASIGRPELLDAVRSALAQTVTDHLVLVIADGVAIPPLPHDPRLVIWRLPVNSGSPSLARNVGIRVTRSDYVAFLDDDNFWEPDHLERLLPALEGRVAFAYGGLRWVNDSNDSLGELSVAFDRRHLREENFIDTSTLVVRRTRRARFRAIPRRRGDATFEDWELAYRLSRGKRAVHVPIATANVRVHEGSKFSLPRPDQVRHEPPIPPSLPAAGAR
ncbi:MAG: family 2 glycosyl transferase [Actinomycetia bacterium]|nr:family 2 glycosyl transferase [Actinomycetes bacterium]